MRKITFAEGEFYHLYNRGVDKRTVFTSPGEYKRFIAYLFLLNDTEPIRSDVILRSSWKLEAKEDREPLVAIGAFCLMPNHFHIYVTPLIEGGISKFMQRLQTAYTMYFNHEHERSGSLFQGTFKAQHVERDAYAKYIFSYIHLNPAKLKDPKWKEKGSRDLRAVRDFIREYPYSSLGEYLAGRPLITDPSKFPNYLSDINEVDEHIDTWLRFRDQEG
jgi:putative transposase